MPFYSVTNGLTGWASDVDQFVDALSGANDVGTISMFAPIATPGAPNVAVNAVAGVLTGVYKYAVAFVTGYWQGQPGTGTLHIQGNTGGGTASATVSPSAQKVNLSAIPLGGTGVVARKIYRTKAGGSTYYELATINDNTTTTYTDNIADASITVAMPTDNTTGTRLLLGRDPVSPLEAVTKQYVESVESTLSTHQASTSVHSATSAATANRLMMRDAAGRAKVAAPSASDDIARLDTVTNAIASLVDSSPATLNTLNELATALGDDPNFATTMANLIATKAPSNSPTLTGTPIAPTAVSGTNTTQIATTAFVIGQAGTAAPKMNSTATVGTSNKFAREDHIHPDDTSKANLASPALTGTPTAPTPASTTNTTQIATTAFVKTVVAELVDSSPTTLDTLNELAAALGDDPNFATTMTTALGTKAPLASPALTGTPTAPTAVVTTNNTQIATTAFVKAVVAALVDSSPATLDTLNELAAALGDDPNFATTMTNALAGKLNNTGGDMSGDLKIIPGMLQVYQWSTVSGDSQGRSLFGHNCYLDGDANFRFANDHVSMGASGIFFPYNGSPKIFRTGEIPTTKDAIFTPNFEDVLLTSQSNSGSLDSFISTGIYKGTFTGYPPGLYDGQGIVFVYSYGPGWEKQFFYSPHTVQMWERSRINSVWSDWVTNESRKKGTPYDVRSALGFDTNGEFFSSPMEGGTTIWMANSSAWINRLDVTSKEAVIETPYKSGTTGRCYHHTDGYVYWCDQYGRIYRMIFSTYNSSTSPTSEGGLSVYGISGSQVWLVFIGSQMYAIDYGSNGDWTTRLRSITYGSGGSLIATLATGSSHSPQSVTTDGTYIYVLFNHPSYTYRVKKYNTSGVLLDTVYIDGSYMQYPKSLHYSATQQQFYLIYFLSNLKVGKVDL